MLTDLTTGATEVIYDNGPGDSDPRLNEILFNGTFGEWTVLAEGNLRHIHDFAPNISYAYIEALAGRLKAACGCGGTSKDRTIEIQGDQPGRIRTFLEQEGFRVAGVS